ncbi:MAG: site-specific integrase [Candidatus Hydrogenedens sp.]|nr:site-specific integrase [Candidatus Hydrogenedens sp.]
MQEYLEETKQELKLRNHSLKTIKSYFGCLREYFDFKNYNLEKIDEEKIKQFLLDKQDKNNSPQTVNIYLNVIKFFYREILKTPHSLRHSFAMHLLEIYAETFRSSEY